MQQAIISGDAMPPELVMILHEMWSPLPIASYERKNESHDHHVHVVW